MIRFYRVLWVLCFVVPLQGLLDQAQPRAVHAASLSCSTQIAMLGADLTASGRVQVERALGVGPSTRVMQETLADEGSTADDLVPPALLGRYAISSVLLHLLSPGQGLHVSLNPNVTLYTSQAYANALRTAGVKDAAVFIAAPDTQRALGTTAMLGLLRAARLSCVASTVTSARQHLALREFMLTNDLAANTGYLAAPRLMSALKAATATTMLSQTELLARVEKIEASQKVTLPANLQSSTLAFLADLERSGAYTIAAPAHPVTQNVPPVRSTQAQPPSVQHPAHGGLASGTIVAVSTSQLAVRQRDGIHWYRLPPNVSVVRVGTPSGVQALVLGSTVHVAYGNAGLATRVELLSPARPKAVATNQPVPATHTPVHSAASPASSRPSWFALAIGLGLGLGLLFLLYFLLLLLRRRSRGGRRLAPAGKARDGILRLEAVCAAALALLYRLRNTAAVARVLAALRTMRGTHGVSSGVRVALAEALGTCFLTLAALTGHTPVAVALTLAAFVYTLGDISGCHLNPAVTLGLASARRIPARTALIYIVAQLAGALLARLLAPQVLPIAAHYASGSAVGEFLGFGFLMLTVVAVSDKFVPRSGSGVAIGAALLAGLLTSKGIINPAIAVAMGCEFSPAVWAPLLSAVLFTGIFLVLAPRQESESTPLQVESRTRRSA